MVKLGKIRDDKKDLTLRSGTKHHPEKMPADGTSSMIGPLGTIQRNTDLERRIFDPLKEGQAKEKHERELKEFKGMLPGIMKDTAKELMAKPFHKWTSAELEKGKDLFGDELNNIIEANGRKFRGE